HGTEHESNDDGRRRVPVDEVSEDRDNAQRDRDVHDELERHPPGEGRVEDGPDHLRHRAEGGQPTDELLAELEGVRLVVEERGPERWAEPEEEDETGDHPDLASAERGADRLPRLEKRRLVRPRAWLARERQA